MRYSDYFDAAGNQKKLLPGEFIGSDFVPGRDDEPDLSHLFKRVGTADPSKVKIVNDYFDALHTHNDLVDNLDRYVDRYNHRRSGYNAAEKKLDDFDKNTFEPAKAKLFGYILPIVQKLFPDFYVDDTRTRINRYLKAVNGRTFLICSSYKPGTWDKKSIIIRDDGVILPEFNKVFESETEQNAAFKEFRIAAESKKSES